MSVFYDGLAGLDEIHDALLEHNLPTRQHYQLLQIADSTIHHDVLNVILIELPTDIHEHFLIHFHARPNDPTHLSFIKQYSPDIEEKIAAAAAVTRARILEEIKNLT